MSRQRSSSRGPALGNASGRADRAARLIGYSMRLREFTVVIGLLLPALADAQTWTSPDGFLTVTPPDDKKFRALPMPPPPLIGLWISEDESMRFGVVKMQIPPDVKLIQSSVEEGLAEEIGGEIERLPTVIVSGHEVWKMTATAESAEITQATVRHKDAFYKVMAATVGSEPDSAAVTRFVDSLSIRQPSQDGTSEANQSKAEPGPDAARIDLHNVSKAIGGAGALLGIAVAIYLVARSRSQPK